MTDGDEGESGSLEFPAAGLDVTGSPVADISNVTLYRICSSSHLSPWFFKNSGLGRFDLVRDGTHGTCYFANDAIAAICEVLRDDLKPAEDWFVARSCWSLRLDDPASEGPIVDLLSSKLRAKGITNEIWACSPGESFTGYRRPQAWADVFFKDGFGGLFHGVRHLPDPDARGISLFGPVGAYPRAYRSGKLRKAAMAAKLRAQLEMRTGVRVEGSDASARDLTVWGD